MLQRFIIKTRIEIHRERNDDKFFRQYHHHFVCIHLLFVLRIWEFIVDFATIVSKYFVLLYEKYVFVLYLYYEILLKYQVQTFKGEFKLKTADLYNVEWNSHISIIKGIWWKSRTFQFFSKRVWNCFDCHHNVTQCKSPRVCFYLSEHQI